MPTRQPNYWKFGVIAAIVVALFLLGRSCGINSVLKTAGSDTVIYRDSLRIVYQPTPYKVIEPVYEKGRPYPVIIKEDSIVFYPLPGHFNVDSMMESHDYNRVVIYDSTIDLLRGTARLQDTVTRNRIAGRSIQISGTDTTITRTVTLTPPRRLVGYLDLTGMGGRHDFGAGVGFSLKLPSDRAYGVGVSYLWNGKMMYYGRASIPIRIR